MPGLRFASILFLLPVLAAQQPADAGAAASAAPAAAEQPRWQRARAVWFGEGVNPVAAELCIGAEAAPWRGDQQGQRLPLGSAGWATLASFTAFTCGDAKVKKGCYYLALERGKDGDALLLFDPAKLQKAQLLPPGAGRDKPVARLPLQHEVAEPIPLGVYLLPDKQGPENKGNVELQLRWGPHAWRAKLTVQGAAGTSPIAQQENRGCSRLAFGNADGHRQPFLLLDHGQPKWSDDLAGAAHALPKGGRWRLGQNWWTTLDANCGLTIGGKPLAAGSWHLSLKKLGDEQWSLVCTPAADDVGSQLDAFAVDHSKAALEVPLAAGKAAAPADELQVLCERDGDGHRLRIAFGDRELSAPLAAK